MYALRENLGDLRKKCRKVASEEEAIVVLKILEKFIGNNTHLSAPELGINSSVAIVRAPQFSINIVNPEIIELSEPFISFSEKCFSFSENLNCLRYNKIHFKNFLNEATVKLVGQEAILVQHLIDHLQGVVFYDRVVRAVIVESGGKISKMRSCPCGSKKVFKECCMTKEKSMFAS